MELSDSHKISQEKWDFKISDVLITARPYRFHLFQTAFFRCFLVFKQQKDRTWVFSGYESRLKNLKQRHKGQ